jgi:hypothetical protein
MVTALSGVEHMARVAREVPMYREIIARAGMKKLPQARDRRFNGKS